MSEKIPDVYFPEYRIYKPNNQKNGGATKFQLKIKYAEWKEVLLFVESSNQTGEDANGNATFGWKDDTKKVTMKFEELDIGEFLCVLTGTKEFVGPVPQAGKPPMGLFHKNLTGNTSLQFSRAVDKGVFYFRLAKKGKDGKLVEVKHTITYAEAQILRVLLENAIARKFW